MEAATVRTVFSAVSVRIDNQEVTCAHHFKTDRFRTEVETALALESLFYVQIPGKQRLVTASTTMMVTGEGFGERIGHCGTLPSRTLLGRLLRNFVAGELAL